MAATEESAIGQTIEFKRPDGTVGVIQEGWGLDAQIRGVAEERAAAAGFTALVPDLYRGKSILQAEEAHQMTGLNFADAASQDIRGAVQCLKDRQAGSGKVGITGFCMGGALTLLASTMTPEADAAVVRYGLPPLESVNSSKITMPLMVHWATQDRAFDIASVDALAAKLKAAGVRYEPHRYLAHHGFAHETAQGPRRIEITQYDAAWAQLAWDRTMRFFGAHLA